jgi:drug/metabolite transporter (DMT)-like permease
LTKDDSDIESSEPDSNATSSSLPIAEPITRRTLVLVYSLIICVQILWALNVIVTREASFYGVPAIIYSAIRAMISTPLLFILSFFYVRRNGGEITPKDWRIHLQIAVVGVFGAGLNQLLFFFGVNLAGAATGMIIQPLLPVISMCFAVMFRYEKLTWLKGLSVLISIAGRKSNNILFLFLLLTI